MHDSVASQGSNPLSAVLPVRLTITIIIIITIIKIITVIIIILPVRLAIIITILPHHHLSILSLRSCLLSFPEYQNDYHQSLHDYHDICDSDNVHNDQVCQFDHSIHGDQQSSVTFIHAVIVMMVMIVMIILMTQTCNPEVRFTDDYDSNDVFRF